MMIRASRSQQSGLSEATMDVTKVRCDECGDLKPVHKQQTMTRRMKARSVWATPSATYIWTCCYDCWTAHSDDIDVWMLRSMAVRLRQHAEASQFRWNATKINEAAELCIEMAEELSQRQDAN
jgi:hypothetical protein